MHYKNGREAHIGDFVVGITYNLNRRVIAGQILGITEGSGSCNCTVGFLGTALKPVDFDYSQCSHLYHAEDAYAAIDPKFQVALDIAAAEAPHASNQSSG